MKPHPYEEGFGRKNWALFNGVGSRDISRKTGKYALTSRVTLFFQNPICIASSLYVCQFDVLMDYAVCHVGIA